MALFGLSTSADWSLLDPMAGAKSYHLSSSKAVASESLTGAVGEPRMLSALVIP